MRVLVACEFSATVRDAFRARGHDAWSCDLEPCEGDPRWHFQDDVLVHLDDGWDLMIGHPPCTYLCNSGVRWLYKGGKGTAHLDPVRYQQFQDAAHFFVRLQSANIPLIALENPIPHNRAKQWIGMYDQVIQPWQFGHGEIKATCLWLKGLPNLTPSKIVQGRTPRVHHASPGPLRWKERSRTLSGIAEAMADQWGSLSLVQIIKSPHLQANLGPTQMDLPLGIPR